MADTTQGNGGGGFWQAVIGAGAAGVNAITKGGPKRQYKYNKKLAQYQNDLNRKNQQWLLGQQREMTAQQLEYDSPAQQQARLKAAGLNPNLMYGSGTVGNMGSPTSAGSLPGVSVGQVDAGSLGNLGTDALQGAMMASQVDLTQARTAESEAKAGLIDAQKAVAMSNPMLDPRVAEETRLALTAVANSKRNENTMLWQTNAAKRGGEELGSRKVKAEIEALEQKLGLNTKDLEIKNKILTSKEYDNALKLIQKKWMEDGDITPQHIYQGLMMLFMKMM